MKFFTKKNITLFVLSGLIIIISLDRFFWATVMQWREDEATNIWLGMTLPINDLVVGLPSSKHIPNPNGMPILGFFLSFSPSLIWVSFFLGMFQSLLLVLFAKSSLNSKKHIAIISACLLSFVCLRSTGGEFWNQIMLVNTNLLFMILIVKYFTSENLYNLAFAISMAMISPALYLAGLLNSVLYTIVLVFVFLVKPPLLKDKNWIFPAILLMVWIIVHIKFVWLPYFNTVSLNTLLNVSQGSFLQKLKMFIHHLCLTPPALFSLVTNDTYGPIFHDSTQILDETSILLGKFLRKLYQTQVIICSLSIFLFFIKQRKFFGSVLFRFKILYLKEVIKNLNVSHFCLLISISFVILAYGLSPVLGGYAWTYGERLNTTVQLIPFILFFVFMFPLLASLPDKMGKIIRYATIIIIIPFVVGHAIAGITIVNSHLSYTGNYLSEADVPVYYKSKVVDFVATDWKNYSSSQKIPIEYHLGGGRWDWLPEVGRLMDSRLKYPYTFGRAFDYELLRKYDLHNAEEGNPIRQKMKARYIVNYLWEPGPIREGYEVSRHIIGRYRVSIFQTDPN